MVEGNGSDLVESFQAYYAGAGAQAVIQLIVRTVQWLNDGASGARSINALSDGERKKRELFSKTSAASAEDIERALIRALRELSNEPFRPRIGIYEVSKQTQDSSYVWRDSDLPRQRGARKAGGGRLLLVVSKLVDDPMLPGPSAMIPRGSMPDAALVSVIKRLHAADPEVRVVDIELDGFVNDLSVAQTQAPAALPYRMTIPRVLREHGLGSGRAALLVPPVPEVLGLRVDGPARDLYGLRAGYRGIWSEPVTRAVEQLIEGELVSVSSSITVSDELAIGVGRDAFRARIARVKDVIDSPVGAAGPARLVAVMGSNLPGEIVDMAVTALSATDDHPQVARFMQTREWARVFKGEQRSAAALGVDRAIASVAFAAYQLDQRKRASVAA
jgi:hypothetical protein